MPSNLQKVGFLNGSAKGMHAVPYTEATRSDERTEREENIRWTFLTSACPDSKGYREARQRAATRKGGWAVAQSPILITTITPPSGGELSRLRRKGYESMLSYYLKYNPVNWGGALKMVRRGESF